VVKGVPSAHPESGSEGRDQPDGREGKAPAEQSRPPRVLRSPDDPKVLARVEAIRAKDGPRAAAAYRRTVEEAWARKRAADLLTDELGRGVGGLPS